MDIKMAFLDVDGVLTNTKFPLSSPKTIKALRRAEKSGCKIILTTAKPAFSKDVLHIIKSARLDNFHITFAGALIINPLSGKILQKKEIPASSLEKILTTLFDNNLFIEIETKDDYYLVQSKYWSGKRLKEMQAYREVLFGKKGRIIDLKKAQIPILSRLACLPARQGRCAARQRRASTPTESGKWVSSIKSIIKIITAASSEKQKNQITTLVDSFKELNLGWAQTPQTDDIWWGMITDKDVSKEKSVSLLANHYKVPLSKCLGVGDSLSDWNFMKKCGVVATVGNGPNELKKLVKKKLKNGFIAPTVNNEGTQAIFQHFNLISPQIK